MEIHYVKSNVKMLRYNYCYEKIVNYYDNSFKKNILKIPYYRVNIEPYKTRIENFRNFISTITMPLWVSDAAVAIGGTNVDDRAF